MEDYPIQVRNLQLVADSHFLGQNPHLVVDFHYPGRNQNLMVDFHLQALSSVALAAGYQIQVQNHRPVEEGFHFPGQIRPKEVVVDSHSLALFQPELVIPLDLTPLVHQIQIQKQHRLLRIDHRYHHCQVVLH